MNAFIGDFPHEPEANLSRLDRLDGLTSSPVACHTDTSDRPTSAIGEAHGRVVAVLAVLVLFVLAVLWIFGLLADSVVLLLIVAAAVAAGIWVHAHSS